MKTKKAKRVYIFLFFLVAAFVVYFSGSSQAGLNEFDLSNSNIDKRNLLSGGPAKDGIPAISSPKFVPADDADFLGDDDFVIGVTAQGESKAYPIKIMNWHEIVNDKVSGTPVAVTWCPLTKSGVVFDRRVGDDTLEFGVSGLLYNSNVVMYDRNHQGLWSQMKMGALSGPLASEDLNTVPSIVTKWGQWKQEHPQTLVLSRNTGHFRNYTRDPYISYHTNNKVIFPLTNVDSRLPAKSLVIGITIKGTSKAYPLNQLRRRKKSLVDTIAGVKIKVHRSSSGTTYITDEKDRVLPAVVTYWFAWSTFNQDTLIYQNQEI